MKSYKKRKEESAESYVIRIAKYLPNWPEEVIFEWLFRHNDCLNKYQYLRFERFQFTLEYFPLELIPGREAFHDPRFCDNFKNVQDRGQNPYDWLAIYMLRHATWNTPIILLKTNNHEFSKPMRKPFHLLEGHRRLSFLNGLKEIGIAGSVHKVWTVTIDQTS